MTSERLVLVNTSGIIGYMNHSLYTRALRAMADLKGAVYELIAESGSPLSMPKSVGDLESIKATWATI